MSDGDKVAAAILAAESARQYISKRPLLFNPDSSAVSDLLVQEYREILAKIADGSTP
jgi:hypothetical protein